MKRAVITAAVAACAGAVCSAQSWTFDINGLQEVPANGSPGLGVGTVTYNAGTNTMTWSISWSGLLGTPTAMHFHQAPAGANGGHAVHIHSFTPATTGTSVGVEAGLSPSVVAALFNGGIYLNIHTTAFNGGEIRGQVVPTPGVCAMLGIGLVAANRRRR